MAFREPHGADLDRARARDRAAAAARAPGRRRRVRCCRRRRRARRPGRRRRPRASRRGTKTSLLHRRTARAARRRSARVDVGGETRAVARAPHRARRDARDARARARERSAVIGDGREGARARLRIERPCRCRPAPRRVPRDSAASVGFPVEDQQPGGVRPDRDERARANSAFASVASRVLPMSRGPLVGAQGDRRRRACR